MGSSAVELLVPKPYVQGLIRDIKKAKKRIVIFSHIIAYDSSTEDLVDALCAAAERGVAVEVSGDVFTYGILGAWKVLATKPNRRIQALRAMVKRFKKSGVKYRWIGQFGPFLFAGRTHVKWSVIDDIVYSFGGINLYQKGLEEVDYMLRLVDQKLGDHLVHEQKRIAAADKSNRFYKSHSYTSSVGTVLIDGGRPQDSIIFRRAYELAEKAKDITLVSQYCPTGKVGKILTQKNAMLYFSHAHQAFGLNKFWLRLTTFLTGYRSQYKRDGYIHAKFMLFTMPSGQKVALTGSHNFVRGGVILGNREIALETSEPQIITLLEQFCKDYIV